MRFNLLESSTMQQMQRVQRVQQQTPVAAVERDATLSLCNRESCTVAPQPRDATHKSKTPDPWPPIEFCLPNLDTLEDISRGEHLQQQELFREPPDDSRAGTDTRARCLLPLLNIDGVTTADSKEH